MPKRAFTRNSIQIQGYFAGTSCRDSKVMSYKSVVSEEGRGTENHGKNDRKLSVTSSHNIISYSRVQVSC